MEWKGRVSAGADYYQGALLLLRTERHPTGLQLRLQARRQVLMLPNLLLYNPITVIRHNVSVCGHI